MTLGRGPLRIVFFGTDGVHAQQALVALASEHAMVGIVRPHRPHQAKSTRRAGGALLKAAADALGLRPTWSLARAAHALGAPVWEARGGDDPAVVAHIRAARPDLVCVAGYPWLLRGELLDRPPAPMLNVHTALLPRHRGVLPLFWIYHADDRETGVTVHAITARADTGDILGQTRYPLPRGHAVDALNRTNAEEGARLLLRITRDVAAGTTHPEPQDDTRATAAPRVAPGAPMVAFAEWDVERVWHFLAGLYPRFVEPLALVDGTPVRYRGVLDHARGAAERPGTVTVARHGFDLHCLGGTVRLSR